MDSFTFKFLLLSNIGIGLMMIFCFNKKRTIRVLAGVALLILIFLSSCCPKITQTETTKSDTTFIATADTFMLPGDTVYLEIPIYELCDTAKPVKRVLSRGRVTGTVEVNNGIARFKCAEDSLKDVIKQLQTIITNQRDITKVVYKCENKFHYLCIGIAGLSLLVFIVLLVRKF